MAIMIDGILTPQTDEEWLQAALTIIEDGQEAGVTIEKILEIFLKDMRRRIINDTLNQSMLHKEN